MLLDGAVEQWLPDVDDIPETADDRPLYPDWLRETLTATKPYTGEQHFPGWPVGTIGCRSLCAGLPMG
jgi:hypothetical protein